MDEGLSLQSRAGSYFRSSVSDNGFLPILIEMNEGGVILKMSLIL